MRRGQAVAILRGDHWKVIRVVLQIVESNRANQVDQHSILLQYRSRLTSEIASESSCRKSMMRIGAG
jgi:hypothetical protein